MAESNASRGDLFQDEIWVSRRPVIKISAGRYWRLLGSKPARTRWARRYITLGNEICMSYLCPWPIQVMI